MTTSRTPSSIILNPVSDPALSSSAIKKLGDALSLSGRKRLNELREEAQQSELSEECFFRLLLREAEGHPDFKTMPKLYLESLDGRYLAMSAGDGEDDEPFFVYHITATRSSGEVEIDGQEWVRLEDYRWREQ